MLEWSLLIACLALSIGVATLVTVVRHLGIVKAQQRVMHELINQELTILQNHEDMLKAQAARRPDLAIDVAQGGKMRLEFSARPSGTAPTPAQGTPTPFTRKGLDKAVRRGDEPAHRADSRVS